MTMRGKIGRPSLLVLGLAVGLTVGLVGCPLPMHVEPKAGWPASSLEVRVQHADNDGAELRFRMLVDERRVGAMSWTAGMQDELVSVKPGWHRIQFDSRYLKRECKMVEDTFNKDSSGRPQQKQECSMVTVARCHLAYLIYFKKGQQYNLRYAYRGNGACVVSCQQKRFFSPGTATLFGCSHIRAIEPYGTWW